MLLKKFESKVEELKMENQFQLQSRDIKYTDNLNKVWRLLLLLFFFSYCYYYFFFLIILFFYILIIFQFIIRVFIMQVSKKLNDELEIMKSRNMVTYLFFSSFIHFSIHPFIHPFLHFSIHSFIHLPIYKYN